MKIQGNIYAYDLNTVLINVYQQIQSQPQQFYKFLSEYWDTYDNCNPHIDMIPPGILKYKSSNQVNQVS